MDNFPIDLTNVYCYWYGIDRYINMQNKDIKQGNFSENHVESLWLERWFAKQQNQKIIDQHLQIFKNLIFEYSEKFSEEFILNCRMWEKFAMIILFDQISRNIFRRTPMAYQFDLKARRLFKDIFDTYKNEENLIEQLPIHNIITLVLVLIHQESIEDQNLAQNMIKILKSKYNGQFYNVLTNLSLISDNHKERVEFFGRIPERNKFLNRKNEEKEIAYLEQVDSRNILSMIQ